MRQSQKSNRPRNKNGRKPNAPSVNRVYESSGPEGKVRGTPQQIIEKYQSLSRDKQVSGDRVLAESFLQHAEHYMRILIAAQGAQQPQQQRRDERDDDSEFDGEEADFENAGRNGGGQVAEGMAVIGDEGGPEIVPTPESLSGDPNRPRRRDASEGGEDGDPARRRPRRSGRRGPRAAEEGAAADSGAAEGGAQRQGGPDDAPFDGGGRAGGESDDSAWPGDGDAKPASIIG